tara:strand:- start:271 stop:459 length:189 start_codon:yes stop_codon:yes gene_type:complete
MTHLLAFHKKNPKMSFREAMSKARPSYKKGSSTLKKTHKVTKHKKRKARKTARKGKKSRSKK